MSELTEQLVDNLRTAAYGSMALVSHAEPGFFAMFKEGMAGSSALAKAPAELRDLLKQGGMPERPTGTNPAEIEASTLAALSQAVADLGPESGAAFKQVVLDACQAVAESSKGVSDAEEQMIDKIKAALG